MDSSRAGGPALPEVETIFFAQHSIVSAATGYISFIEVFTQLLPPSLPSVFSFHVTAVLRGRVTHLIDYGLRILGSDGSILWSGAIPIPEQRDDLLYVDMLVGPITVERGHELRAIVALNGQEKHQRAVQLSVGAAPAALRAATSLVAAK